MNEMVHSAQKIVADSRPSTRSLLALDGLNFFVADVVGGIGPYIAVYLKSNLGWQPGDIGMAIAAASLSTAIAQTPAGALVDGLKQKRLLIMVAALIVSLTTLLIVLLPTHYVLLFSMIAIGTAAAVFAPSIAGISLGLVGPKRFDQRAGRNEAFNHGGNVLAAGIAALLSQRFSVSAVFPMISALGLATIASTSLINPKEIDYLQARGGESKSSNGSKPSKILAVFEDRRMIVFAASVLLFHFANAAMLPQVGQKVAQSKLMDPGVCMSACIIVAQLCMVPAALFASHFAGRWGRKPVFLIGFLALPLRGLLFAQISNPYLLIATQMLDGVGAGIYGVLGVVIAADLTRGTGRFNSTQGIIATSLGVGAGLSNLMTGQIVQHAGFSVGFYTLAGIAVLACLLFATMMPETLSDNS